MIRKAILSFFNAPTRTRLIQFYSTKIDEKTPTSLQNQAPEQKEPKVSQQPNPQTPLLQKREENEQEYVYQKENRNTLGWWAYRFVFWGITSLYAYNIYLVANNDKKKDVENQFGAVPGIIDAAKATYNKYNDLMSFMLDPPAKKFLPDPIHPLVQPKTLVLNLSGTLIKTDFVFGKGMLIKRRPGLQKLLKSLVQKYQIIVFSNDDYNFIMNAQQYLDPRQMYITGYFGKQCLAWSKGVYIKDLKYLNRQIRNIVVVDCTKDLVQKHPQNVLVIKQFDGSDNDQQLMKLVIFLQKMSGPEVRDVRKFMSSYGENPVQNYYDSLKKQQEKIKTKAESGLFGYFSGTKSPPASLPKI